MDPPDGLPLLLQTLARCVQARQHAEYAQTVPQLKKYIPELYERVRNHDLARSNFDQLAEKARRLQAIADSSNQQLQALSTTQYQAVKSYNEQKLTVEEQAQTIRQLNREIQQLNMKIMQRDNTIDAKSKSYMRSLDDIRTELTNTQTESKNFQQQCSTQADRICQLQAQIDQLTKANQTNIQTLNQQLC